jgi:hypothetical protein
MIRIAIITSIIVGLIGFLVFHKPHQQGNLVKPITQIGQWYWQAIDPAKAVVSAEGDALRCDISKTDGTAWHVQYMFKKVTLVEGRQYRLRFAARATPDMVIVLSANAEWMDHHTIGLEKQVPLINQWVPYDYTFIAEKADGRPDRVPIFGMGTGVGTVWIKDLVLEEL